MPRHGLRRRFVAACLLLVTITTAGYYVAVAQSLDFLETEMRGLRLEGELQELVDAYTVNPDARGPQAAGLTSYILPAGADPVALPERLRTIGPGMHKEIRFEGDTVAVARRDVNGARLYVVLDLEPLERLERRLVALAWMSAVVAWAAAIVLALWLARRVMQPLTELANLVGNWHPGDYRQRLGPYFADREVGVIASSLDRFLERLEAFVGREQAFTEDASHELRTPLAVIESSAELLAEDATLSAPGRERLLRIQRATAQMQMLIEALLFLSREDGGQPAQSLPLERLVADVVDSHRDLLAAKPVALAVNVDPVAVHAPRGMATCVISNLLLNAIHYTERGTITLHAGSAGLRVEDTGIGIPPDDLGRIFERRFRGAHSRGLGLGLYLVKRICDRLGWAVRVESAAGVGTRFEVSFPPVRGTEGSSYEKPTGGQRRADGVPPKLGDATAVL